MEKDLRSAWLKPRPFKHTETEFLRKYFKRAGNQQK